MGTLSPEVGHVVCNGVSRQESWSAFASASIQGQPLSRATRERRSVHSLGGLPRDSFLPCQWLLATDEQQSGKPHADTDPTGVDPRLEHECQGSFLSRPLAACLSTSLNAATPISWWKCEMPETRCGPCEFHCNLRRSGQFLPHGDDPALSLFPAFRVLH